MLTPPQRTHKIFSLPAGRSNPLSEEIKDAIIVRGREGPQPEEHHSRNPAEFPDRCHRRVRQRQEQSCFRYSLCRRSAPLHRISLGLCPPVPGTHRPAGCGRHRRDLSGARDSAERTIREIHARRLEPSPKSTTTCACFTARIGTTYCHVCGRVVEKDTPAEHRRFCHVSSGGAAALCLHAAEAESRACSGTRICRAGLQKAPRRHQSRKTVWR